MFDSFVTKLNGKAIFHIERIYSMRSKKKKMNKKKKKKKDKQEKKIKLYEVVITRPCLIIQSILICDISYIRKRKK